MTDLGKFGFVLPETRVRGPRQRIGSRLEVHRAGPTAFTIDLWSTPRSGAAAYHRKVTVDREEVMELWAAIQDIIRRSSGAVKTPDLSSRQIIAQLIARCPDGTPGASLSPESAMGGVNRAAFYFPRWYYPSLVLEHYYAAIERHGGRSIRVRKKEIGGDEIGVDETVRKARIDDL